MARIDYFCIGIVFTTWITGDQSEVGASIGLLASIWLAISIIRDVIELARKWVKP